MHGRETWPKNLEEAGLNPPLVFVTVNGSSLIHDASLLSSAFEMPILNEAFVVVILLLLLCLMRDIRRAVTSAAGMLIGSGLRFAGNCWDEHVSNIAGFMI